MKNSAIVFIGSTVGVGLSRHFALSAREFHARCSCAGDDYFATLNRECDKGAMNSLREWVPSKNLILADDFKEIFEKVATLFEDYDFVLVHAGGGYAQMKFLIPMRKKYGSRLILIVTTHSYRHDSWKRVFMSAFQCLLYRSYVDMVIFQCPYAARRFVGSSWFFRHGKRCVIPLGVEPFGNPANAGPEQKYDDSLMQALGDNKLFKFVYLASFRPGKKHVWLVEHMAGVLKRHPNVRIVFCGDGDNAVKIAINAATKKYGITGQILVPGRIQRVDVPWLLSCCDCAVVPSRAETFGHTFIEPMAAGIPVMGTRVGVGEYMVRDYETGLGFDFSRKSLDCAAEYLVTHREECRLFGENARRLVQSMFLKRNIADMLTRLYKDLLEKRGQIETKEQK